jgi:hypothetical protein
MSTVGYVVVEYNQASQLPDLPTGTTLYDTAEDARDDARFQAEQTAQVGRREQYRVAEVTLLDDED